MDIEEDIKIVKEFNQRNRFRDCGRLNNAIDHILAEREEDKKKIEELEEHQKKFYNGELYTAKQLKQIEENQKKYFISKQKVYDKIDELNEEFDRRNTGEDDNYYILSEQYAFTEEILKELLEDK